MGEALSTRKMQEGGGIRIWSLRSVVEFGHCGSREVEVPEVSKIVVAGKQCVLLRTPGYSVLISSALAGAIFLPRRHSSMSRDNFGHYNLENANGMQ